MSWDLLMVRATYYYIQSRSEQLKQNSIAFTTKDGTRRLVFISDILEYLENLIKVLEVIENDK